jgi:hypothetical protein
MYSLAIQICVWNQNARRKTPCTYYFCPNLRVEPKREEKNPTHFLFVVQTYVWNPIMRRKTPCTYFLFSKPVGETLAQRDTLTLVFFLSTFLSMNPSIKSDYTMFIFLQYSLVMVYTQLWVSR